MPFQIIHNNITKMKTEAIVNAANTKLLSGGGVCGAIFEAAGETTLQKECNEIVNCEVGQAVITKGYKLNAKYIIHAVGPIWRDGNYNEAKYLKSAYRNSLQIAKDKKLKSISFPLISSGTYGYPKEEALSIAVSTIKEFLDTNDMDIYLVVFDRKSVCISKEIYNNITHYINSYYEDYNYPPCSSSLGLGIGGLTGAITSSLSKSLSEKRELRDHINKRKLEDILNNVDESFSSMVLRLILQKGKEEIDVYKKANMDRKLFSKIRSNKNYRPKKNTAISLAIALELSLDETKDLLEKAGYTLSPSYKFDLIIQYFVESREYDIYKINEALFNFEEPLLVS